MRPAPLFVLIFAVLFGLATAARRLFFADVAPIASPTETPQSLWSLDAAFLLQTLENIALLGLAISLVLAAAQWIRQPRRPAA